MQDPIGQVPTPLTVRLRSPQAAQRPQGHTAVEAGLGPEAAENFLLCSFYKHLLATQGYFGWKIRTDTVPVPKEFKVWGCTQITVPSLFTAHGNTTRRTHTGDCDEE